MKRLVSILIIVTVFIGLVSIEACRKKDVQQPPTIGTPLEFKIPQGWQQPLYNFDSNRLTKEGFDLGRKLFYDGRLSGDGTISCGSCHQQVAAFGTFDHNVSHGINNSHTTRNAPPLHNLAWQKEFGWDGAVNHLDLQPLTHITSVTDMGETISNVLAKLRADAAYRQMFKAAFGDETITTQRMTKALSQFMVMMVSNNSKYDKVKRGEATFNLPEQLGYDIFKAKCVSCHTEPMFTDNTFRNVGLPVNVFVGDIGRMMITLNRADSLKFKVPSLRNVELTYPYEHDGRFSYLDDVLEHYRNKVVDGPSTDPLVRNKIPLSNFEIGQLKSFLAALTDTAFIRDKKFSE